jgi:hypothetical protein
MVEQAYKGVLNVYDVLQSYGYQPRADILSAPAIDLRGFDERWYDSGLSAFRRQLQALKVIPKSPGGASV